MTQSNTPKPLSVDGFLKGQCRENQVNIKGPFQCILKNIISASIAGTSLYTLLRCPITWLYVMFSQPFKTNLTPLFGWLEATNLTPDGREPLSPPVPRCLRSLWNSSAGGGGRFSSDEKGIAEFEKEEIVKERQWHEKVLCYMYILYICQCIHIACYVYNYDICFKDAIQYSILHDCLSTRKHQQFWWFCHQEHFKTSNVSCVYGFLCVRWRFALCKSSTVFNRLVEYGSDGLKRQLTAENILSGPTRLKQIMSGLLCSKYHGTDLSLNISPRKTCHWFKQLQCHWSYSPLLQSFWNQSTCFLHFVCLISLRCWATRIEHWRKQVHNKSMTTITHYINLYETA